MKHRWMDVVKRGKEALAQSPKNDSPARGPTPPRSQSFADALSSSLLGGGGGERAENPAFFHLPERCKSAGGACSVAAVLEQCVLQGGVHHTHLNVLTHLGAPLRADACCYGLSVQWFRAFGGHDDFRAIPGACDEFFTATADDIGARILAKVMLEDEDVVKTKMLEYGPIKEDPEVRSKVEMYLERKSVLFMGLQSIALRDGDEYPDDVELRESWTLLIDDRRVRLTCESSLIPPFEALYTCDIKVEVVRSTPNEFCLHLAENCYVHLRAESNIVRDIVVLTLRAFCNSAVLSEATSHAVAQGLSPMLTIRTLSEASAPAEDFVPAPEYNLPWNRQEPDPDLSDASSSSGNEKSPVGSRVSSSSFSGSPSAPASGSGGGGGGGAAGAASSPAGAAGAMTAPAFMEEIDDSLLLDAEALIGNAMKMGIKNQILPRAPKRISIVDIPDLQILEALVDAPSATSPRRHTSFRHSFGSASDLDGSEWSRGSFDSSAPVPPLALPELDGASVDDALRNFQAKYAEASEMDAMKTQYTAIFCALQRELSDSKKRLAALTQRLDEKSEENAAFRSDIETLQSALTAMQVADKVNELVAGDLKQLQSSRLLRGDADDADGDGEKKPLKPLPENYY